MEETKNVKLELEDDDKTFISHTDKINSVVELHMFYNELLNGKYDTCNTDISSLSNPDQIYIEEFVDRFKSRLSTHTFSVKKFAPLNNESRVKSIFLNYISDILFIEFKNYRRKKDEREGIVKKTSDDIEIENIEDNNNDFEFTNDDLFYLITITMNIIEELSAIVNHHDKYGEHVNITKYQFLLNYILDENKEENVVLSSSPKKYLDETIIEIANTLHKVIELKGNNKKKIVLSLLKKTLLRIYREFYGEVISEIQSIQLSYYIDLIHNGLVDNIIDLMVKVSKGEVYLNNLNGFISYTKDMLMKKQNNKCVHSCTIM